MSTRDPFLRSDLETPNASFQCGFGVYCGTLLTALVILAALFTGVTDVLTVGVPSTLTVGIVAGAMYIRGAVGIAERIGRSWRRWLLCVLPPVTLVVVGIVSLVISPHGESIALTAAFFAIATAFVGYGVAIMSRTRYVTAVVDDADPAARWAWKNARPISSTHLFAAGFLLAGVMQVWSGSSFGYLFVAYGLLFPLFESDWVESRTTSTTRATRSTLEIHDTGLVESGRWHKRLVPWASLTDVRLTDDELVIERSRWFAIRCARDRIDDAETVLEELERRIGT